MKLETGLNLSIAYHTRKNYFAVLILKSMPIFDTVSKNYFLKLWVNLKPLGFKLSNEKFILML